VALAGFHHDVAAAAAIAARRPAARHKFLPPERHTPVPTIAGLDPNYCFVDKHLFCRFPTADAVGSVIPPRCHPITRKPKLRAMGTPVSGLEFVSPRQRRIA
jgi:hypothetical protein